MRGASSGWCRLLLLGACLVLPWAEAQAQGKEAEEGDAGYVEYREKVMESLKANMGAIGDILKYKLPYAKNVVAHAEAIQAASGLIEGAFQKEVATGKTEAKPEIWQEWEKFQAEAKKMEAASAKLVEVAKGGDLTAVGAAVRDVGAACGGCHQPYRIPREGRPGRP